MIRAIAAWTAIHTAPTAYDARMMIDAADAADPADEVEDAYLQGVIDALQWRAGDDVTWESPALVDELHRQAGFDRAGQHVTERETSRS